MGRIKIAMQYFQPSIFNFSITPTHRTDCITKTIPNTKEIINKKGSYNSFFGVTIIFLKIWIDLAFLTSAFNIKVVIFIYAIEEIDSKNLLWTFLTMISRFLPSALDRVKLLIPSGGIFQKYVSPAQQKEWGKLPLVVFFSIIQNGSRSRQSIPFNKERSYWITFNPLLMGKSTIYTRMINSLLYSVRNIWTSQSKFVSLPWKFCSLFHELLLYLSFLFVLVLYVNTGSLCPLFFNRFLFFTKW